jgi:IS30 family transposase
MNQLNVSLQHSILTLAGHGWSARRIARELDVNRETVGKYLRLAQSKPAIATAGAAADSFQNQPFRPSGPRSFRRQNQPFRPPARWPAG